MKNNTNIPRLGFHIHRIEPSAMSLATQQQLTTLLETSQRKKLWTWHPYSPNPRVKQLCEDAGISHHQEDLRDNSAIVIPAHGAPASLKKRWKAEGRTLYDLSLPETRRVLTTLGLLKLEGAELVIIGRKDDPEVIAYVYDHRGVRVVENAEDAVRIPYAPHFGIVCQTSFCPVLARHLSSVIRNRHRDSRVTFYDTSSAEENQRRLALSQATRFPGPLFLVGHSLATEMMAHAAAELRISVQRIKRTDSLLRWNQSPFSHIHVAASSDVLPQQMDDLIAALQAMKPSIEDRGNERINFSNIC
jgi:4-hydroxy-3-methylbut-2-enyl diphosphate reductase IspH